MKILVCGPRDWVNESFVYGALTGELGPLSVDEWFEVISGGARGVDSMAIDWAEMNGVSYTVVPANWHLHGKAAGPIRNQRMVEMKPDKVIAFGYKHRNSLTVGTRDMVDRAKKLRIPVTLVFA